MGSECKLESVGRNNIRIISKLEGEEFIPLFKDQNRPTVQGSQGRNSRVFSEKHKLSFQQSRWKLRQGKHSYMVGQINGESRHSMF